MASSKSKSQGGGGYSQTIEERAGVFHASYWPPGAEENDAVGLGNYPTRVDAERALQDAVAQYGYVTEGNEAVMQQRDEQFDLEQERKHALHERHVEARDTPEHKSKETKEKKDVPKDVKGTTDLHETTDQTHTSGSTEATDWKDEKDTAIPANPKNTEPAKATDPAKKD